MGSTRLPGKVLEDIHGRTMLEHVLRRLGQAEHLNKIVVATTIEGRDAPIVQEAKRLGAPVVRGSEQDVLDRYYRAAQAHGADTIVRVTSDCPLVDPGVVDDVIQAYHAQRPDVDYVSNTIEPRTFPRGLDVEVFSYQALHTAWEEDKDPATREHVTPYIYQNPGTFQVACHTHITNQSHHRWTVDEPEDLAFVRGVYERVDEDAPWESILETVEAIPELEKINADVKQKRLDS